MSLNDSLNEVERAKLAVWDYPVSDKYTKMWQAMKEAQLPVTMDEALKRVRDSKTSSDGFAYLGVQRLQTLIILMFYSRLNLDFFFFQAMRQTLDIRS